MFAHTCAVASGVIPLATVQHANFTRAGAVAPIRKPRVLARQYKILFPTEFGKIPPKIEIFIRNMIEHP